MKICVFSDIHGNMAAFQQMLLAEKQNINRFYFLGDIFGYFCEQSLVIDTLMNLKNAYSIKGNHDNNYILALQDESYKKQMIEKYGMSYDWQLSCVQLEYIQSLPEHMESIVDGLRIGFFHGGPNDFLEQRIYPDTVLLDESFKEKYDYVFVGHTHYRFYKKFGETYVVNPGSLGQPRDGKGFSYGIFDTKNKSFEFKNIEIDIKRAIENVKALEHESSNCLYLIKKYGGAEL